MTDWSLGEQAYQAICADILERGMRTIVEFGSGFSTLRLSRDFHGAQILSVESDPSFYLRTQQALESAGNAARVQLDLRPLVWQRHSLGLFCSYRPGWFPKDVDAVLIDGPPIQTRRGREACLYQVFPYLRIGARIYLDDYCRRAEQQIVRNWLRAYPGELVHQATFSVSHQVAVLDKVGERRRPAMSIANSRDSMLQGGRHLLGQLRRGFARVRET